MKVATFQGEWTAEQIDAGLAGEPSIETQSAWYENTADGTVEITDAQRIAELEKTLKE